MPEKAKQCDECAHHSWAWHDMAMTCNVGHKPRFYLPGPDGRPGWGYKRRCNDFEESKK